MQLAVQAEPRCVALIVWRLLPPANMGPIMGQKESALSAIVTTMNRVDDIYRKEMAITFELVGNNDDIVFIDPDNDPFAGNNDANTLIAESQTQIDSIIGSENYDIGHTFSTGAGGLATLQSVCNSNFKARGVTGSSTPEGDPCDVDYVAHELGHQFGGYHTFNSKNCAQNRTGSSAYEPGGGTTIQAYAGICSSDDIQANSDPMFHSHSFDQMYGFASEGAGDSCAFKTSLNNTPPTADAGLDFSVPMGTPLVLSGSGSDVDGDALQYSWEQFDLGVSALLNAPDDGSIPLFSR